MKQDVGPEPPEKPVAERVDELVARLLRDGRLDDADIAEFARLFPELTGEPLSRFPEVADVDALVRQCISLELVGRARSEGRGGAG
jgi:hypothetical protein